MPIRPLNIFSKKAPLFGPKTNDYYFGNNGKTNLLSNEMLIGRTGSLDNDSFHFDPLGYAMRSTQQIPLDWSQFKNHTFFNSAEANVNMAFNTLINEFPFDGSRNEMQTFLDGLTGFEKWVYDSFPKNKAYLKFENNSFITVSDRKGYFAAGLSRDPTGAPVISNNQGSITFEFDLFVPSNVYLDNAVIVQKIGDTGDGFSIFLSESQASDLNSKLVAIASSGNKFMSASWDILRGNFQHTAVVFNMTPGINRVQILAVSGTTAAIKAQSSTAIELGNIDFITASLMIGSGSSQNAPGLAGIFVPRQTLSGALDDLRIFQEARTIQQVQDNYRGTVYPIEEPRLVYIARFNEPTGSYSGNNIVLDGSGNGLHGYVNNFTTSLRIQDLSDSPPNIEENLALSPVLFPTHPDVINLNTTLLASASNYDVNNPSLIVKLIPRHLLLEASQYEGYGNNEDADTGAIYGTDSNIPIPGSGKIGSPQIISAFLFTMAKQFDEYKIFIDHFSKLMSVGYDSNDTISDQLINFLGEYNGFDGAPFVYKLLSAAQYYSGQNITVNGGYSPTAMKTVAAQLMRRILINYQDIIRSKGTRHSIEAVFRAIGINPDTSLRIREFGGVSKRSMQETRRKIAEVRTAITLSGTIGAGSGSLNAQGFSSASPYIISPFLSQSRTEPGYPYPSNIISTPGDGLLTSASFTIESLVRFPGLQSGIYDQHQSIFRLHTTGSDGQIPLINLVAVSESFVSGITGSINLYVRSIDDAAQVNFLSLPLTGVNLFDGNDWYISVSRNRGDVALPFLTSSWYVRAGLNRFGSGFSTYTTTSIFNERESAVDLLSNVSIANNASGSFLVVGSQSFANTTGNAGLTNSSVVNNTIARSTKFEGQFSELRFWSKHLNEAEFQEHVQNPRSVGVVDPHRNYNFISTTSGSWERLRLDISTDQPVTQSDGYGNIQIIDFSQNFEYADGFSFEPNRRVILPRRRDFTIIEPKFDERSEFNKVRIRSFQNDVEAKRLGIDIAPVYELKQAELPQDDTRLSIEVSIIRGLDEDITNILATLEAIEIAIGRPESLYSINYKELDDIRNVYFNRLTEKINFQTFFEFYSWFDTSIGQFIAQLLPTRTDFFGTNFVIESHMLERQKIAYKDYSQYLRPSERTGTSNNDFYIVDTLTARTGG